ncbi:MAG: TMEM175 family protein [Pseudomonadota bacterium]
MPKSYNDVAGKSVERIAALSDGLFAIAMTLLVLELHAPAVEAIHSEGDLWAALQHLAPKFLVYLMSFMTLGIFWVGQQTQLNLFERADRHLTWIQIAFLAAASVMPFSTALLGEFIGFRLALGLYWLNIVLLGATLLGSWLYARRAGLLKEGAGDLHDAVLRRILVAQSLYAVGAALCFISPLWSIAFIMAVQLNYALGWPLQRL